MAGITCERTFKHLFNAINPMALEKSLRDLAELLRRVPPGKKEHISFDGQTSRGTADKYVNLQGIHLLNRALILMPL